MPELNGDYPRGSVVHRWLNHIALPSFIRRIDQYLLTNYPVVWRTRAHYLILANGLLSMLVLVSMLVLGFHQIFDQFPRMFIKPSIFLLLFLLED